MSSREIKISHDASQAVRAALNGIGRTEDVRFSPDSRRLALACFERNSIAIVSVEITIVAHRPHVVVTDMSEFSSPCLKGPHGMEFLDDETIIVANRDGNVVVLGLPSHDGALSRAELTPIDLRPGRGFELLSGPSSLTIPGDADGGIEVLVCNNFGHTVTRHILQDDPLAVTKNDVLLHRWLDVPDFVAVSADNQWIAISNHGTHTVMLYERSASLDDRSAPDGILRGTFYPHGLRFSADGRWLFVADAGNPYVHVYARDGETWRGVQYPAASLQVIDDSLFQRGIRISREQAGPKGIDIDRRGSVLAVTSMFDQLAFFDVSAVLEHISGQRRDHALHVSYELELQEELQDEADLAQARIAALKGSTSFRITKPLRLLKTTWSRRRR